MKALWCAFAVAVTLQLAAPAPALAAEASCRGQAPNSAAAVRNAASLQTLSWTAFQRPHKGWEIYLPLVGREIASTCDAGSDDFAESLANWQQSHRLTPDGIVGPQTLNALLQSLQRRRRFVGLRDRGLCPEPPDEAGLSTAASPEELYNRADRRMLPEVYAAWRNMVRAARASEPELQADPRMLAVFSAYRSPGYDAKRCARDGNCNGVERASCSAHRTGTALDIFVGEVRPGNPDNTVAENRLFQSRTRAYRWLVRHAREYGFENYPYEPWHWEWNRDPKPGRTQ